MAKYAAAEARGALRRSTHGPTLLPHVRFDWALRLSLAFREPAAARAVQRNEIFTVLNGILPYALVAAAPDPPFRSALNALVITTWENALLLLSVLVHAHMPTCH